MKPRTTNFEPPVIRHRSKALPTKFTATTWAIKIANRQARKSSSRYNHAFTLLELIIVIAVIAVLAGMLLPSIHSKGNGNRIKCVNNLKQVGLAFKAFAADNNDKYPIQISTNIAYADETRTWIHFQAMTHELQTPKVLMSPGDKTRLKATAENFNTGNTRDEKSLSQLRNQAVSYFVNASTDVNRPQAILAGTRNISLSNSTHAALSTVAARGAIHIVNPIPATWSTHPDNLIHDNQGNLLLGDGSVQQASVSILVNQMKLSTNSYGPLANRFVFPQ